MKLIVTPGPNEFTPKALRNGVANAPAYSIAGRNFPHKKGINILFKNFYNIYNIYYIYIYILKNNIKIILSESESPGPASCN